MQSPTIGLTVLVRHNKIEGRALTLSRGNEAIVTGAFFGTLH